MVKASRYGAVLAESDRTIVLEGNLYFPPDLVQREFLQSSDTHTICPWRGKARYKHVDVNGRRNADAACYYPQPSPAAKEIKDYVAFWNGVRVEA